jgi:hypothetical protein
MQGSVQKITLVLIKGGEWKRVSPHGILVSVTFQTSITLQNLNENVRHYIPSLNGLEEVDKMGRIGVEVEEVRINIRVGILSNVVGHQD